MTSGARDKLISNGQSPIAFLLRHSQGDWGEVDQADWQANERNLEEGGRLLSSYRLSDGMMLWIITEADCSATVLLLPDEY